MTPLSTPAVPDSPAAPAAGAGFIPASPAQEQLWAMLERYPDRPVGNLPVALNVEGPLDAALLGHALNDVVARHDILRMRLDLVDGQPVQVIAPALNVPLPVVDLRLLPPEVREAQAFRLAREEAARVLDARRGPLLRAQLFLFAPTRHILVVTFHRAAVDPDSIGVFLRDLAACYEARRLGLEETAPPAPPQFAVPGEACDDATRAAAAAWWDARLAGEPAVAQLPSDRPGSGTRRDRGRVERLELSPALRASAELLARREGTNPFIIVLAALQVLLHRYTSLTDFVLGLALSERSLPAADRLIGPCLRAVPFRASLAGDPDFRTLLARVRADLLDVQAHTPRVPFSALSRRFRHPVLACPVQFLHERRDSGQVDWPGIRLQELELDSGACACELAFHLVESTGRWSIRVEYDGDAFTSAGIQRMLAHFNVLLHAAVSRPGESLCELPLLTPAEQRRLLSEWNNTVASYPRDATVQELVSARAAEEPDTVAVAAPGAALTWRQLDQRSNQLGRHLRAAGVRPGQLVALALDRTPDLLVGIVGALKAGGGVCLLDPALPVSSALVRAARPSLVLTLSTRRRRCFAELGPVLLFDGEAADIHRADESELTAVAGPDDFAWLCWTNGTEAAPKPVELSHRALVSAVYARRRVGGVNAGDVVLSASPLGGADAVTELLLPLAFGARLELASVDDLASPARLAARAAACAPTHFQAAPSLLSQLLDAGWAGHPALRLAASGEPLTRELADRLLPHCRELWNVYGPAESGGGGLAALVPSGDARPVLGRPLGNVQVHLLDGRLHPVPVGITGELYVGGDTLATGYRDLPAATINQFPADPFRRLPGARLFQTGDLGRRLANGEIEHLGRCDRRDARRAPLLGAAPVRPAPARSRPRTESASPAPAAAAPTPVATPAAPTAAAT